MIAYTTLGTNDLDRAANFYDALLSEIGATRMIESERVIGWSTAENMPMLGLVKPFNGEAATAGNGTMVALACQSQADVDKLHAKALSLGATDEGAPGIRNDPMYLAYFRDLDGNKLSLFHRS